MAVFEVDGLDALIRYVDSKQDTGDLASECLEAAGQELEKAWKSAISQAGHVKSGGLLRSVTHKVFLSKNGSVPYVSVYLKGKSKPKGKAKGTAYSYIAYVLNYGAYGRSGSRFKQRAENLAKPKVEARLAEIWKNFWS